MTLNEMRCIYPVYAEKERLLREQAINIEREPKKTEPVLTQDNERAVEDG